MRVLKLAVGSDAGELAVVEALLEFLETAFLLREKDMCFIYFLHYAYKYSKSQVKKQALCRQKEKTVMMADQDYKSRYPTNNNWITIMAGTPYLNFL